MQVWYLICSYVGEGVVFDNDDEISTSPRSLCILHATLIARKL